MKALLRLSLRLQASVDVLAEISLRSPRTLFIFIIKKYIYRIKVSKNKLFNFEKNFTAAGCVINGTYSGILIHSNVMYSSFTIHYVFFLGILCITCRSACLSVHITDRLHHFFGMSQSEKTWFKFMCEERISCFSLSFQKHTHWVAFCYYCSYSYRLCHPIWRSLQQQVRLATYDWLVALVFSYFLLQSMKYKMASMCVEHKFWGISWCDVLFQCSHLSSSCSVANVHVDAVLSKDIYTLSCCHLRMDKWVEGRMQLVWCLLECRQRSNVFLLHTHKHSTRTCISNTFVCHTRLKCRYVWYIAHVSATPVPAWAPWALKKHVESMDHL